jgi:hypothetical protein
MGWMIGAIVVVISVFALIAIKAVCAVGPLLDENEALKRYGRLLEQREEETARQTGWKLTHLEIRLERQTEITNAAFRRETNLLNKLAKHEGREVWSNDDEGLDYLESPKADRDPELRGCCTCDEAYEAMHDLEGSCELHS